MTDSQTELEVLNIEERQWLECIVRSKSKKIEQEQLATAAKNQADQESAQTKVNEVTQTLEACFVKVELDGVLVPAQFNQAVNVLHATKSHVTDKSEAQRGEVQVIEPMKQIEHVGIVEEAVSLKLEEAELAWSEVQSFYEANHQQIDLNRRLDLQTWEDVLGEKCATWHSWLELAIGLEDMELLQIFIECGADPRLIKPWYYTYDEGSLLDIILRLDQKRSASFIKAATELVLSNLMSDGMHISVWGKTLENQALLGHTKNVEALLSAPFKLPEMPGKWSYLLVAFAVAIRGQSEAVQKEDQAVYANYQETAMRLLLAIIEKTKVDASFSKEDCGSSMIAVMNSSLGMDEKRRYLDIMRQESWGKGWMGPHKESLLDHVVVHAELSLLEWLVSEGFKFNDTTQKGEAFHKVACRSKDAHRFDKLKLLLTQGLEVNAISNKITPLDYAITVEDQPMIDFLMSLGALRASEITVSKPDLTSSIEIADSE